MALRAAELEVLFTANTTDVDKAEKTVKATGERIEKKPVTKKIDVDTKQALDGMARVEKAAMTIDGALDEAKAAGATFSRSLVQGFLESDRVGKKTAAEIEAVLVKSYHVSAAEARKLAQISTGELGKIEAAAKHVAATDPVVEVKAETVGALASMDRVESAAKKLVSQDTSLKLDADIGRAEKSFDRAKQRLADLEVRALGGLDVTADVRRAEAALSKVDRQLTGLRTAKTQIEVEADTSQAEAALDGVSDDAGDAGDAAGDEFGKNIVAALVSIPIAGAVIGIGVAAGKALIGAFNDGLQVEVGNDRLQALTGISEADALRLGRAAGEAYSNTFGDSIESNMDTTRLALQFDIIDADTSTRSAQKVVEGLSGIAEVLGEDVRPIAAAVTTLLSSGVAKSAENAFDLLATGAREGVNRGEDLIDTFTEYPAVFARLGLSGEEALGLMSQGLKSGARNSDIAADALKEFQILATDGSEKSAAGFRALGMNAEDMTAKIAAGGEGAREGLAEVLDGLRAMQNPVERTATAIALFGTKAEDMGATLFAMDLSTAVDQLNGVTGAAQTMFDTLTDNDASKMEQARRNIEVAADGMKGALAAAFADPLGEAADWISANRGPMLQFFLDLANGALDFGVSMVESTADGTEALGEFVSGPLAGAIEGAAGIVKVFNFGDDKGLGDLADSMRGFKDETSDAADAMRENLIPKIEGARDRLNEFGEGAVAMGFLNDASLRLAGSLGEVGVGAEGALISLDGIDLANVRASDSGRVLSDQVRDSIIALQDEQVAASASGESQDALAQRYIAGTDALAGQLTQMGLTEEQARALIDTVLQTPPSATTVYGSNVDQEQAKAQALADRITTLPDGSVVVLADTAVAQSKLETLINSLRIGKSEWGSYGNGLGFALRDANGVVIQANGGVVEFMAQGGMRGLTPMSHTAQVVPPSTWRVVGDRGDVPESFIPIDGSARSMSILLETMRRMGVMPMAAGGITDVGSGGQSAARTLHSHQWTIQTNDPEALFQSFMNRTNRLGAV